jgi:hypothetical protein
MYILGTTSLGVREWVQVEWVLLRVSLRPPRPRTVGRPQGVLKFALGVSRYTLSKP